jgi:CRISPR-associated protein Cmr6
MDKLAIGLGGQSVFENDITLHHIYGIPYIPGQAIKGSMRNYIIREEKEFNGDEIKAVKNYFFRCIFGSGSDDENADQGKVIFLDAYPNDKFDLEKDVITTHYTNYYQGSGFPLDTEEPIPNNFLIVKDTCFSFNIGISRKVADENCTLSNGKSVRAFLLETILDVLQYNGLGAKTSVGYGFFDVDRKQIIADEKAKWEEEKRRLEAETEKKKFEEETKGMTELRIEMYKLKKMTGSTKHNEVMNLFKEYIDKVDGDEKIELAEFIKNYLVSENKWNKKNGDKLNKKIERICDILNCEI